ncbi:MAG: penicillin-binding protein 2 [Gemmatimonadota bacterium]|nr:MAG: penicillin-binding protein 2 [Gemmatimonadota bacterium]
MTEGVQNGKKRRRAAAADLLLFGSLALLIAVFFRLQVIGSEEYVLRSEENRLRAITVPAPRGTIYDRHGRIAAENVPGYSISLLPGSPDTLAATLGRLAPYLDLSDAEIERLLGKYRRFPNQRLVVRDDASFEEVSAIEQRRPEFPRAVVEMLPRRHYPAGRAIAHLIGYVGEISEAELERPVYADYEQGRIIGKDGIERQYESSLGGVPGVRFVEVSALGSIVRDFGPRPAIDVQQGADLELGLDLALQQFADSIFPPGMRGGVVALDPRTGDVLVLYSHPTYDPNEFIGGIDIDLWRALQEDPAKPLLNRVSTAAYAPGSTFKLVVASIGMTAGQLGIGSYMPTSCFGGLGYGNRLFRCWKPDGHGPLDLAGAIQQSCNVFFYQAGMRLGLDALLDGAARYGFGRATGIDLPYETPGAFPPSREWFDERYGRRGWTESVVLNLSIGQGENQQSLLRMAQFYAALATGEAPVIPHIVRSEALSGRRANWAAGLPEDRRRQLLNALTAVVNEPKGTAYPYRSRRWRVAGKTGTAQNPHGAPHSWFVGFAPVENPEIVIAAIVEFGHPDNTVSQSVPLAIRIVERYLDSLYPEVPARPAPPQLPGPIPPDEAITP